MMWERKQPEPRSSTRSLWTIGAAGIAIMAGLTSSYGVFAATRSNHPETVAASAATGHDGDQGFLFPAVRDGKYGFIDVSGKFVIPPMFEAARFFSEGLAAVQHEGKWGYINRAGEFEISPEFGSADSFSEGLARATVWKPSPPLDEWLPQAQEANPEVLGYDLLHYWREKYEGKAGYIDRRGLFRIPPKFDRISSPFKNGLAYVQTDPFDTANNRRFWIDRTGREIPEIEAFRKLKVDRMIFGQEITIRIQSILYKDFQYGIKDTTGKIVVEAKFDFLDDFYSPFNGRLDKFTEACLTSKWSIISGEAISWDHKCGVIDKNGVFIAPADFDKIVVHSDNLATFAVGCEDRFSCKSGKWGVFSLNEGKIIVNPKFDEITGLYEGLMAVNLEGKWGFIDQNGKYVIEPQYSKAGAFVGGLAWVNDYDYIDHSGRYVYRGTRGPQKHSPVKSVTRPPEGPRPTRTGSGVVVSRQGHVLTNYHVVEKCGTLRTTSEGVTKEVTTVSIDPQNDLAILKLPSPSPHVAHFRDSRRIQAGDAVAAVGFPFHDILATDAHVTTGTISALAGIGNDARFLQMTVPVQPGNSGGPLLDEGGNVVGVVVSKLDALGIARATGDIPQNINFAINGAVAKAFLDSHSVEYETSTASKALGVAEIGAAAKKFTLLVECFR